MYQELEDQTKEEYDYYYDDIDYSIELDYTTQS